MKRIHEKLKYGSEGHNRVRDAVGDRFDVARRKLADRFNKWRKSEDLFMFYVKETDAENKRRRERENTGKQTFSTIYIPYSYAALMSAFTYASSVFLSRNPVLQYTGRHGESQQKVQAAEAIVDYQVQVGQMSVPFYLWLLDSVKYGVGILANHWVSEIDNITSEVQVPKTYAGQPLIGEYEWQQKIDQVQRYKGNKVFNIRPYDFLPDPTVSFVNLQRGEFCGRIVTCNWNYVLRQAALPPEDGGYFNIEALRNYSRSFSPYHDREQGSPQVELPDDDTFLWRRHDWSRAEGTPVARNVELVEMVIELVPSHWQIGNSDYPEKWAFTVADREVVIGCRPLGARHGMFPYFIQSFEPDSYSFSTRGMLELLKPLNDTLTWLFNSRMYNVRKANADQWLVDPSRVIIKDMLDGEPGKLIRLHPNFYGTDVRSAVTQFPTVDVTQMNLRDADAVMSLMQRIGGASDNVQGMLGSGGRKTATEVRTSAGFGINRLKTISEFNSSLGWSPLAQVILQNTQQYLDEMLEVKIAGTLLRQAKTIKVDPSDLAGFYDFVTVDGTLPIDRFAQAQLWKEILMAMQGFPQLAQRYDIAGIFGWMAQIAGLKNIDQFEVQITPDQQILNQAQKGNIVPSATAGVGTPGGPVPGKAPVRGTPELPGMASALPGSNGSNQIPKAAGF